MILADTSIWVDNFRSGSSEMVRRLSRGQILMHPFVVAELALGSLHGRSKKLNDLEALLEREGGAALSKTAGEAMNPSPRTIGAGELAAKALAILEERKITSLVVVDADGRVAGVVHLHDLWGVELI